MKSWTIWCVAGVAVALAAGCETRLPSEEQNASKALPAPVQKTIELGSGVKLEMVLIPAGSFIMGTTVASTTKSPSIR